MTVTEMLSKFAEEIRENIEKEIKEEILEDLRGLKFIDLKDDEDNLPEYWIKAYDIGVLINKWRKR